jgi:hypothetical protein
MDKGFPAFAGEGCDEGQEETPSAVSVGLAAWSTFTGSPDRHQITLDSSSGNCLWGRSELDAVST